MNSIFNNRDAAHLILATQPKLYSTLVEALSKGVDREMILSIVREKVNESKSPADPQASELIFNLAALTLDYLLGIARQVSGEPSALLGEGDLLA
jgi:hypothetical protein